MGRTLRTVREGEKALTVDVVSGTTTVATIPNYGHTYLTTADGTEFVMDAPDEGVHKTISVLGFTTTSASIVVRGSTATDVTFDGAGGTQLTFSGAANGSTAADFSVDLVGVSATRWVIKNVWPDVSTVAVSAGTS